MLNKSFSFLQHIFRLIQFVKRSDSHDNILRNLLSFLKNKITLSITSPILKNEFGKLI